MIGASTIELLERAGISLCDTSGPELKDVDGKRRVHLLDAQEG